MKILAFLPVLHFLFNLTEMMFILYNPAGAEALNFIALLRLCTFPYAQVLQFLMFVIPHQKTRPHISC